MSSPEHGGPPEQPFRRETEPTPYYRAARFADASSSRRAYARVQGLLFSADCDLSTYRYQRRPDDLDWHVTVFGDAPSPELDQQLADTLASGVPERLTPVMIAFLAQRRAQANRLAPWAERHFRPGPRP